MKMDPEFEYYYVVTKLGLSANQLNVILFDQTLNFNNLVKTIMTPPNNLLPVSGGKCQILVDSLSVKCYRAKGCMLTPSLEDAVTVANFLFRGAEQ